MKKPARAVVIDPGDDSDRILTTLAGDQLTVEHIINTHGHFDHVGANKRLKDVTGADIHDSQCRRAHAEPAFAASQAAAWGMRAENSPAADRLLEDGDTITFGTHTLSVLHTPGHTPGGICLYTEYENGGSQSQGGISSATPCLPVPLAEPTFPGGSFEAP